MINELKKIISKTIRENDKKIKYNKVIKKGSRDESNIKKFDKLSY